MTDSYRIDSRGQWYHNGGIINRKALAKLFSDRALKRDEDGNYWLQTPFEKYPVEVEDVPYVVVDYEEKDGVIVFKTNMDEMVALDSDRPLKLFYNDKEEMKLPYIEIRDGLYARIGRNVYYALVEKYGAEITSNGKTYALGELDV
tara:strand:+ start:66 stop:503 length:438 start_codon:yes stop_codon:yes gene_type:complete